MEDMLKPSVLLIQLVVVVIFFIINMHLFFGKLLEVLRERESKTTLLEENAEKTIEKAKSISEAYRAKIDIAYSDSQKKLKALKEEIVDKEDKIHKSEEATIMKEIEKEREKIIDEVSLKRHAVLKETQSLASDLVNKIVQ